MEALPLGLPRWHSGKESTCNAGDAGDMGSIHVRKLPWRRKWQPTPVFLPGKCHGQRSLASYSPWSHKRVRHNLATKQQQEQSSLKHSHWNRFSFSGLGGRTEVIGGINNGNSNSLPDTKVKSLWTGWLLRYVFQVDYETVNSKNAWITNLIPFLHTAIMLVLRCNCVIQY